MAQRIQHFSHNHRLTLRLDDPDRFCDMCGLICKGLIYSCKGCSFHIHKTCAELPQKINHHFHPQHPLTLFAKSPDSSKEFQCHACGKVRETSNYHCSDSKCIFDLDLDCAALMPTKRTTESSSHEECQIDHHVVKPHPHPLILCKTEKKTDFYCSGCKLIIENGSIYVCIQCKSILHKSCSELSQFINHPFHPNHTLTLLPRPYYRSGSFLCNACGALHDGLTFNCSECKFDLDINCAFLMGISTTDHQIDHPHPLILCKSSKTKNKFTFVCSACQLPFMDYGSFMYCCLNCRLLLHKSCAELPAEIQLPIHPNHPLAFTTKAYFFMDDLFRCRVCRRESKGSAYTCYECDFIVDIPCSLSTSFVVKYAKLHDKHLLAFSSVVDKNLRCHICHSIRKSPSFRCVECDFNFHVLCVPTLPPTASDGNHRHPLTLTKSWVRDYEGEGRYAEFYCDRCENERKLTDPTYYCPKCHYVAHVHCVIHEVVRFMEEEWSLAQKIGDTKLLGTSSTESSQENSNHELASRVSVKEEKETTQYLTINSDLHNHPLTFFTVVADYLYCNACHLYSDSNLFRCEPCNFNLHISCISTLPPTIKFASHWHPLTLSLTHYEEEDDDDGQLYCDICEHERMLSEPTYYCAACRFVAHVHCIIPEIKRVRDEVRRYYAQNYSNTLNEDDALEKEIAAVQAEIDEEQKKLEEQELKVEMLFRKLEALKSRRSPYLSLSF